MSIILVEGDSDRIAVVTLAARLGLPGQRIVVIGGAHGARRKALELEGNRLLCLVDRAERAVVEGIVDEVFVCDPDLEGEFIRALGVAGVERVIAAAGELESFRRLQRQPAQRERRPEAQLARFFGGRSGNKARYARLLAEAVPLERLPPPLAALLLSASASRRAGGSRESVRRHARRGL